ncbi:MAG: hypothetical protein JWM09_105 [Francisellaceae bacterium]|nr:hypothetical protein [Francisellaceae bacterium]
METEKMTLNEEAFSLLIKCSNPNELNLVPLLADTRLELESLDVSQQVILTNKILKPSNGDVEFRIEFDFCGADYRNVSSVSPTSLELMNHINHSLEFISSVAQAITYGNFAYFSFYFSYIEVENISLIPRILINSEIKIRLLELDNCKIRKDFFTSMQSLIGFTVLKLDLTHIDLNHQDILSIIPILSKMKTQTFSFCSDVLNSKEVVSIIQALASTSVNKIYFDETISHESFETVHLIKAFNKTLIQTLTLNDINLEDNTILSAISKTNIHTLKIIPRTDDIEIDSVEFDANNFIQYLKGSNIISLVWEDHELENTQMIEKMLQFNRNFLAKWQGNALSHIFQYKSLPQDLTKHIFGFLKEKIAFDGSVYPSLPYSKEASHFELGVAVGLHKLQQLKKSYPYNLTANQQHYILNELNQTKSELNNLQVLNKHLTQQQEVLQNKFNTLEQAFHSLRETITTQANYFRNMPAPISIDAYPNNSGVFTQTRQLNPIANQLELVLQRLRRTHSQMDDSFEQNQAPNTRPRLE